LNDLDILFEAAQIQIFAALGCSNVKRKPKALAYKLSSAPRKDASLSLQNEADWQGLKDEAEAAGRKKKAVVSVEIIAPADVRATLVCPALLSC
jgi:hypothetical protein